MCRMIIACGKIDPASLLDAFLKMALGENEQHERNADRKYNHPHGWGIAYVDAGKVKAYKNHLPVWEDKKFAEFRGIQTGTLILHARHSSGTPAHYENTQPFFRKTSGTEYVFTHNGSIKETLEYDDEFYPLGETDSEMFFYHVLTILKRDGESGLTGNLSRLTGFSAANFILLNYPAAMVNVEHTKEPVYYTMKYFSGDDSFIASSEVLPGYEQLSWTPIENNTLITLNVETCEYRMEEYGDS